MAREAKALAPSACVWAAGGKVLRNASAIRRRWTAPFAPSIPSCTCEGRWIVRRLAPDCSRVELASMPKERDETKLLRAMGFETANVHLGTPRAAKLILPRSGQTLHRLAA